MIAGLLNALGIITFISTQVLLRRLLSVYLHSGLKLKVLQRELATASLVCGAPESITC